MNLESLAWMDGKIKSNAFAQSINLPYIPFEKGIRDWKKDEGGVNLSQSDVINANNTIASVMGNKFARLYAWAVRHERMTGRKTHASWHV